MIFHSSCLCLTVVCERSQFLPPYDVVYIRIDDISKSSDSGAALRPAVPTAQMQRRLMLSDLHLYLQY